MNARRSIRVSRRRLWGVVAVMCMAMACGTFSGGNSEFRIVHVRGSRVHIRTFVPSSLHHLNVRRHLYTGEAFYILKERRGISHTGSGAGTWAYVRGLSDPALEGWINAEFLAESGGYFAPDPPVPPVEAQATAPAPAIRDAQPPPSTVRATRNDGPSAIQWTDHILSILSSLLSMFALFATFGGVAWLFQRLGLISVEPNLVPITSSVPVSTQHFIVGSNWRIRRTSP